MKVLSEIKILDVISNEKGHRLQGLGVREIADCNTEFAMFEAISLPYY